MVLLCFDFLYYVQARNEKQKAANSAQCFVKYFVKDQMLPVVSPPHKILFFQEHSDLNINILKNVAFSLDSWTKGTGTL